LSVAKRTPPSRGGTREGQRTSEAGLGKDSGLPRRDSGGKTRGKFKLKIKKYINMQTAEEREELFRKISSFLKKYGATRVSIFGSYVRGEEKPESDIDVLVEFADRKSLLTLVNIELELSDYLGIKVDLLTEKSISPYLIDGIKKEAKVISE